MNTDERSRRDTSAPGTMKAEVDVDRRSAVRSALAAVATTPLWVVSAQAEPGNPIDRESNHLEVCTTRSALALAEIHPDVIAVRTLGFNSPGDGGGALFVRVRSEPTHAGKIRTGDGSWWELAESSVDVKMFGACGNGTTDDTAAIQDAIDTTIALKGGEVFFSAGIYVTTRSLMISHGSLVNLRGVSRNAAVIRRINTTSPILRLTECSKPGTNSRGFSWRELTLEFSPAAAEADSNAIGASFETGSGNPIWGHVNFRWESLNFLSCYDAVTNRWSPDGTAAKPPNVWGWRWENIVIYNFARRIFDFTNVMDNGAHGGFPNCHIASLYTFGRRKKMDESGPHEYQASLAFCDAADGWTIESWEHNLGTLGADAVVSLGGRGIEIVSFRCEGVAFKTHPTPALIFIRNATARVGTVVWAFCTATAGVTVAGLRLASGATGELHNVDAYRLTGDGRFVPVMESTGVGACRYLGATSPRSESWVGQHSGYASPTLSPGMDGVYVFGKRVLGARKEAIGTISHIKEPPTAAEFNEVVDKINSLIYVMGAKQGHGLTGD